MSESGVVSQTGRWMSAGLWKVLWMWLIGSCCCGWAATRYMATAQPSKRSNLTIAENDRDPFVPWPHRRVFEGYLEMGQWIAGRTDPKTVRGRVAIPAKMDEVQRHAFAEGVFYPMRNGTEMKFHIFQQREAQICLKGRKIYIMGDSYMKHMFIGLADILTGDPSNFELRGQKIRSKVHDDLERKLDAMYTRWKFKIKYKYDNCRNDDFYCTFRSLEKDKTWASADAVVINVLVHHLEMHRDDKDLTQTYLKLLERLFTMRNLKLTWMTGPSYDISKVPQQYIAATNRRPTNAMNIEAIAMAKRLGIPLIDIFTLTRTCTWANCTADGGHRSRFVNRMKAQMLLNNLCRVPV